MSTEREVYCNYCLKPAVLVKGTSLYPRRTDLAEKNFWACWGCKAWVGCHPPNTSENPERPNGMGDGTMPLGRLADEELRKAKNLAHRYFDRLWKDGHMSRRKAYHWLAHQMDMSDSQCHIGKFEVAECFKAAQLCQGYLQSKTPNPLRFPNPKS